MKCCGQEIQTAFCPDCGKPIGGDPFTEIRKHVEGLGNTAENARKRMIEWDQEHPDRNSPSAYRREEKRAACNRKIAKFKRWLETLDSMAAMMRPEGQAPAASERE